MKNDHFENCKAVELPPIDPPLPISHHFFITYFSDSHGSQHTSVMEIVMNLRLVSSPAMYNARTHMNAFKSTPLVDRVSGDRVSEDFTYFMFAQNMVSRVLCICRSAAVFIHLIPS